MGPLPFLARSFLLLAGLRAGVALKGPGGGKLAQLMAHHVLEDYNLRRTLKKQLYSAGVPKIEILRIGPGVT